MEALILSCSTGGGHNAAGYAVREELERQGHRVDMMDPYSLRSQELGENVGQLYVRIAQKTPRLFGAVYALGEGFRRIPFHSPVYGANLAMVELMHRYLQEHSYDVILMPHLFPAEILTAMKARGLPVPMTVFIATDYTCIPFTEETDCDYYVTPSPLLTEDFLARGLDPERLKPFGIPVRQAFREQPDRQEVARLLGLDPDRRYLLLAGGSIGAGGLRQTLDALQGYLQAHPDSTLITVCGKNPALHQQLQQQYAGNRQICLLQSTDRMAEYMRVSDVLLSKPGGLTSTEAAVAGIPLIHIAPIPGCEQKNAAFFSRLGLSENLGSRTEGLVPTLERLRQPQAAAEMIRRQRQCIPADAAPALCRFLSEALEARQKSEK